MKTTSLPLFLSFTILILQTIKCDYSNGEIKVNEEYINTIDFKTNIYQVYRMPHGITYKQIQDSGNDTFTSIIDHTKCPNGESCEKKTQRFLKMDLERLKVLEIKEFEEPKYGDVFGKDRFPLKEYKGFKNLFATEMVSKVDSSFGQVKKFSSTIIRGDFSRTTGKGYLVNNKREILVIDSEYNLITKLDLSQFQITNLFDLVVQDKG
jgi:hypothetical protein